MAINVGTLEAELLLDLANFVRNTRKVQDGTKKMESSFRSLTSVVKVTLGALAAREVIRFGNSFVQAASDAQEAANLLGATFGRELGSLQGELAGFARETGRSEFELQKMAGTLGALLVPMTGSREEGARLSAQLTQLATDAASFFNTTDDQALNAFRAAITGETEPIKRFGVNLTEAQLKLEAFNLGITKNFKNLTQSEKVQLRVAAITRQLALAQGDAARTSDGLANLQRNLISQYGDIQRALGQELLPVVTVLAKRLFDLGRVVLANQEQIRGFVRVGIVRLIEGLNLVITVSGRLAQAFYLLRGVVQALFALQVQRIIDVVRGYNLLRASALGAFDVVIQGVEKLLASLGKLVGGLSDAVDGINRITGTNFNPIKSGFESLSGTVSDFAKQVSSDADNARAAIDDIPNSLTNLRDTFAESATSSFESIGKIEQGVLSTKTALDEFGREVATLTENLGKVTESAAPALTTLAEVKTGTDKLNKSVLALAESFGRAVGEAASGAKDIEQIIRQLVSQLLAQLARLAAAKLAGPAGFAAAFGLEAFGGLFGFAKGGVVRGPGGVDNVPIRATAGEAVLSKDVTDLLRQTLNMPRATAGNGFAGGGVVQPPAFDSGGTSGGSTVNVQIQTLALPTRAQNQKYLRDVLIPELTEYNRRRV